MGSTSVDDNQILRTAIEKRLDGYQDSFDLITAVDGFDAVQMLKEHPVSLVVVDLIMPRMDGMSLINHIRQYYRDLPIIIVSKIGDKEVSEVARNSDAFGYLNKPFQADELIGMIQQILDKEAEGGIMNDVSPPVFMQLMEMDAKTGTIRILDNQSDRGGILYFNQGELFDARVGELSGIDAAYQIFSWDRTSIFINNFCNITENTIGTNLGTIIMKAVGMKDESEEDQDDYNEGESIASLSDGDDYAERFGSDTDTNGGTGSGDDSSLNVVRKKLEGISGISSIGGDLRQEKIVEQLQHLGNSSGFGNLVMAAIDEGRESG